MSEKTVTMSNGSGVQHSTNNNNNNNDKKTEATDETVSGPKPITEPKVLALLERTGYPLTQENGQRLYGPPLEWNGTPPARGCEIFVGKIPRDCLEDELIPIFERAGKIYQVRLMMDFSGLNKGYCFVTYSSRSEAKRAVKELNDYEVRRKKFLGACLSVDNCRLFVGGIPREKQGAEILAEMKKIAEGVVNAIVYPSIADKTKNRGFAFVEFESHRAAAMARRKLLPGRVLMFNQPIAVDWAEPEPEVDEDVMSKVRILYVRNLMLSTTEETLERVFSEAAGLTPGSGGVERVKKLKDYAFVHFRDRNDALKALNALNGEEIDGVAVEVVFAKPVARESQHGRHNVQRYQQQIPSYPGSFAPGYPGLAPLPLAGTYMPGVFYHQSMMNGGGPLPTGPPANLSPVYNSNRISTNQMRDQHVSGRGQMSRGRTAAGSRGAGGWAKHYSANNNSAYRQNNPGDGVYDLQPGMELIPANTQTIKSHNRSPPQLLEDLCQRNGWGQPSYHLHQAIGGPGLAGAQTQLFVFKVHIQGLSPTPFMSNKLCRTVDEAKRIAAEFVLQQLGMYSYGSYPTHAGGVVPVVNSSLGPQATGAYQHHQQ